MPSILRIGQDSGRRWIQINHPDLVENLIDKDGDGLADGGYIGLGNLIDAVEVQNFSPSALLARVPVQIYQATNVAPNREFLWLQLLNRGHRLVAMAVADAHSVHGNGVGDGACTCRASPMSPPKSSPKPIFPIQHGVFSKAWGIRLNSIWVRMISAVASRSTFAEVAAQ
jgi:hypothetical protein